MLAVELFVIAGRLLVNELAPRPHNSGHWTLDAAVTSQFDQQVRAVTGAALGGTDLTTAPAVAMVNLLGDLWFDGPTATAVEPRWRRRSPSPTPACTSTASATRGAAARWATSRWSATTRPPPPSGRSPCARRLTAG